MNKELLLRVKEQILAEPNQFVMSIWFTSDPSLLDESDFSDDLWKGVKIPNCGTAACIAGWLIALNENKKPSKAYGGHTTAAKYLEVDFDDAGYLFFVDNWDDDLRERWENATSLQERAQVAAEQIDRFVESHE